MNSYSPEKSLLKNGSKFQFSLNANSVTKIDTRAKRCCIIIRIDKICIYKGISNAGVGRWMWYNEGIICCGMATPGVDHAIFISIRKPVEPCIE